MAKCFKCGAEVLEGALFCTECGVALTEAPSDEVKETFNTADEIENPFEMTEPSKPSNPFAEMEANVPKPELASMDTSSLIFDEPDWRKAEKIEAQADAAAEVAAASVAAGAAGLNAQAQAIKEDVYNKAEEDAAQAEAQTASGQKGFFQSFKEGMAGESPQNNQASVNQGANQQGAWSNADAQAQYNQQTGANQQTGWAGANQQPGANPQWNPDIYNQDYMDMPQGNDKLWAILSYFWLILWVIAFFAGAVNGRRSNFLNHHLNQSLILSIVSTIAGWIGGTVGWVVGVVVFVFGIMGIVYAAQGSTKPLPIIGNFKIFR